MIEYATLLNLLGRYEEAYTFIMANRFHPWEGDSRPGPGFSR